MKKLAFSSAKIKNIIHQYQVALGRICVIQLRKIQCEQII